MSLRLIIKQVSRPGQDSRLFRAYNPGKTGQPDISLGITASTTGNADHGARRCAVIEGLRELYSMAVAQQMSKDDTFAGWPDMVRVIDYIEQHGLPPLTGGDNE